MFPAPAALLCLVLCLQHPTETQSGPLPTPVLRALPSSLVPLGSLVTIQCQGPPRVDLYRLEKLGTTMYQDQDSLSIPIMKERHAGRYRCSYQNGSIWSPPSAMLELIATGVYTKPPSLSAHPGPWVSAGGNVVLQCQAQYSFDQFALSKEGDSGPYEVTMRSDEADFPITAATAAHSGAYRCYGFFSNKPYGWSSPSQPLTLTVTGPPLTPGQLPIQPRLFTTEATRNSIISPMTEASTTGSDLSTRLCSHTVLRSPGVPPAGTSVHFRKGGECFRELTPHLFGFLEMPTDLAVSPEDSSPPRGPAQQGYAEGNLLRIGFGVVILVLLAGFLAEDWYSRKKPLPHRVRAVQRPLPSLPKTPRPHGCQDGEGSRVQKQRYHQ
ncbi:platelet glycoprotein VI [Thomomys bottae]